LIGLGFFVSFFAITSVGFNWAKVSNVGQYEEVNKEIEPENFGKIDINIKSEKVVVNRSYDDKIHLKYYTDEKVGYLFSESDNGFSLTTQEANWSKVFDWPVINFASYNVYLSIPDGFSSDINIQTTNAKIEVSDIEVENISIKTSNSKIEVSDCIGKDIKIETNNAKIKVFNVNCENLSVKTNNGQIEAKNVVVNETFEAETSNSKIDFSNIKCNKIFASTSNDKIKAERIDAYEVDFRTTNSDIEAGFVGKREDYTVLYSHTTNLKNNLEQGGNGERTLYIKTSNGKIEVAFEG